jgi:hypothetical protein
MFVFLFSCNVFASQTVVEMNKALKAATDLVFLASNPLRFKDKKNQVIIKQHLDDLNQAFNEKKHQNLLKSKQFSPALAYMQDFISHTNNAFKTDHVDYARHLSSRLVSQCLNCHTQLPAEHKLKLHSKSIQKKETDFDSQFDYANYLYLIRQYDQAKSEFIAIIKAQNFKSNKIDHYNHKLIENSIDAILTINLKIEQNPIQAQSDLAQIISSLPASFKVELAKVLDRLKYWSRDDKKPMKVVNDEEYRLFVNKFLKPLAGELDMTQSFRVDLLISSGVIANFLFNRPESKNKVESFYWLGLIDKYLFKNEFNSLADFYFKECIKIDPKNDFARKCYDEYRDSIEFGFTGTAGTHIPKDVQKELEELLKKLPRVKK